MLLEKQKITLVQLMALIKKTYAIVTPKTICDIFGHNDGGKLLRRHLRAKFAQMCNHAHNDNWKWSTNDDTLKNVIEYAYGMWSVNDAWLKNHTNNDKNDK